MSQAARALAGYGRRSYTRNGWKWRILSIEAVDNRLLIEAEATKDGQTLLWRKDQPGPNEWLEIVNPRIHVDDGEEPNPEFNDLDRFSQPTRRKSRLDHIEALKIELDRFLERRLNA